MNIGKCGISIEIYNLLNKIDYDDNSENIVIQLNQCEGHIDIPILDRWIPVNIQLTAQIKVPSKKRREGFFPKLAKKTVDP